MKFEVGDEVIYNPSFSPLPPIENRPWDLGLVRDIKNGYIPNLHLIWYIELDHFKSDRAEMERTGTFLNFLNAKSHAMDYALLHEPDTLFLDADMIILNKIDVDGTKELGVSPGFINKETVSKVGYYNA
jgi:hypothetical protein